MIASHEIGSQILGSLYPSSDFTRECVQETYNSGEFFAGSNQIPTLGVPQYAQWY
jgi:hypothetical protein